MFILIVNHLLKSSEFSTSSSSKFHRGNHQPTTYTQVTRSGTLEVAVGIILYIYTCSHSVSTDSDAKSSDSSDNEDHGKKRKRDKDTEG